MSLSDVLSRHPTSVGARALEDSGWLKKGDLVMSSDKEPRENTFFVVMYCDIHMLWSYVIRITICFCFGFGEFSLAKSLFPYSS